MNLENVHYDAFISYRHCEKDKFVAESLHKMLEAFVLPSGIRKEHPDFPKKIERVFRDQEELPLATNLEEPIKEALRNSDNLIVICTPRLKESLWCQMEIESFIEMHGRAHVFAVLAEGEPRDSFPYQLLVDDEGYPIEPLGADVRGETHSVILKKMKTESLRLIAPMFGLNYDDLRQRHKEQKMKHLFAIGAAAMAVVLAFGIFSSVMALKIKRQADDIAAQNVKITKQAEEIESQNEEIKKQAHDIAKKYALSIAADSDTLMCSSDKLQAIKSLRDVLPDDKNDELLPYTAECENALTGCLGLYTVGSQFAPFDYYESDENIEGMIFSDDGKYLAFMDSAGNCKVYNVENHEEVYSAQGPNTNYGDNLNLIGSKFFYPNDNYELAMADIESGEVKTILDENGTIMRFKNHDYFSVSNYDGLSIIDGKTGRVALTIKTDDIDNKGYISKVEMSNDEKYIFISYINYINGLESKSRFEIHDFETGKMVYGFKLPNNNILSSLCQVENVLYLSISEVIDFSNSVGYIWAYDMDAGNFLYRNRVTNHELLDLSYVSCDDKNYFFARDLSGPYTIDIEDGGIIFSANARVGIVKSYELNDEGSQLLILKDGQVALYDTMTGYFLNLDYFAYPYNKEIKDAGFVKGMFTFLGYNSNRIGVYKISISPGREEYEGTEYFEFPFEDTKYDVPSKNIVISHDIGITRLEDPEGNIVAEFWDCDGYDEKQEKLVFKASNKLYTIPIYSYEEILKAADDYIAEHGG